MAESGRRLLFLSHAGADTPAAEALRRAILNSVAAHDVGLDVWLDVKDLGPGDWQAQIESGLARMTAFAVLIGKGGVRNWVMPEIRAGLDRAVKDRIPFIPVSLDPELDPSSLPLFIQQYQIIRDPLSDEVALGALLRVAIAAETGPVVIAEEPYVGLRAMTEADQHLFFGRDDEVTELLSRLRGVPLVAVVSDSGAGKSSLVRAALAPAFRRGELSQTRPVDPDAVWHVVTMRPGSDPELGLARGVDQAAEELGRGTEDRDRLRSAVDGLEPKSVRFALGCDLPDDKTEIMLVVDQFEELLLQTPEARRAPFVALLLALARPGSGVRVVLTVRADYFNLLRDFDALWEQLHENPASLFRLRRVSDTDIAEIVARPLTLAGYDGATAAERAAAEREKKALIERVRQDISDRPGDLALLQMALAALWGESRHGRDSLVAAYARVGGVFGALAHEADKVLQGLDPNDCDRLLALMVRLVRPGETGGAIRRTCRLDELDPPTRMLAQRLASDAGGRLVLVDAETVEISHEALIRQWSWLQVKLQPELTAIRTLHQLMGRARSWAEARGAAAAEQGARSAAGAPGEAQLTRGHELELFQQLSAMHPNWLSTIEREFVDASAARERAEEQRKLRQSRRVFVGFVTASILGLCAVGLAAGAWVLFLRASEAERLARAAEAQATEFAQNALAASAEVANETGDHDRAAALAIAALPADLTSGANEVAERALVRAVLHLSTPVRLPGGRSIVAFAGGDDEQVVVGDERDGLALCSLSSEVCSQLLHGSVDDLSKEGFLLYSMVVSRDGSLVAIGSRRQTAHGSIRVFSTETGRPVGAIEEDVGVVMDLEFLGTSGLALAPIVGLLQVRQIPGMERQDTPEVEATAVAVSPRMGTLAAGTTEGDIVFIDDAARKLAGQVEGAHEGAVSALAYARDAELLASSGSDGRVRIWAASRTGPVKAELPHAPSELLSVALAPDGAFVAAGMIDGRIMIAALPSGEEIVTLDGGSGAVVSLEFSPSGHTLLAGTRNGVLAIELPVLETVDLVDRGCAMLDPDLIREVSAETGRSICSDVRGEADLAATPGALASAPASD